MPTSDCQPPVRLQTNSELVSNPASETPVHMTAESTNETCPTCHLSEMEFLSLIGRSCEFLCRESGQESHHDAAVM